MQPSRRFTGRQITIMVAAACAAIVLAPAGAVAATSMFSIADPSHPTYKARVTASGRLVIAPCDSDSCAAVDSGKLRVGDGSGALTVDGTVVVGSPSSAWYATANLGTDPAAALAGPTTSPIDLTSLTVSGAATGDEFVALEAYQVSTTATTCINPASTEIVWRSGQHDVAPQSVSFPTPLRVKPQTGHKLCLVAYTNGFAQFSASGYLG